MLFTLAALAAPVELALTFDDLPSQTLDRGKASVAQPEAITDAILATLTKHLAPATVFVNCGLLGDSDVHLRWHRAGMELANHTSTHVRAAAVGLEPWTDDVKQCHDVLTKATGKPPRYFRYPYLRRGDPERRAANEAVLKGLGERSVPVTIASSEWRLSQLYDATKDPNLQRELREALVTHVVDGLALARAQVAERHDGLQIPHILLLHVNQLEADGLNAVLARLQADGVVLVSLEHALKDPFYARADVGSGDRSHPWQFRVAPAWEPGQPDGFSDMQTAIDARWAPKSE